MSEAGSSTPIPEVSVFDGVSSRLNETGDPGSAELVAALLHDLQASRAGADNPATSSVVAQIGAGGRGGPGS